MQAERADLRVAVQGAVFEMSEAKRWLLGGYNHGFIGGISHAVATEMAFAFRFTPSACTSSAGSTAWSRRTS